MSNEAPTDSVAAAGGPRLLPLAQAERDLLLLEKDLVCPMSQTTFEDPVRAADGHLYERSYITQWFETRERAGLPLTSPLTRKEINNTLIDAPEVVKAVQEVMNAQVLADHKMTFEPPFFRDLDNFLETAVVQSLNLRPPAIVPIGVESAGKSTVLERIMGLALLPRDAQLCTRMVIRVHLRRRRVAARPSARLVIRSRTPPFGEDAATERTVPMLDLIAQNVKEMMDAAVLQAKQPIVMGKELLVEVFRADVPDLDVIDVPGLVTMGVDGTPRLTEQLVQDVIHTEKDHGIFLAVVPATERLSNSITLGFLRKHQLKGSALGIRSKVDDLFPESDDLTRAEVVATEVLGALYGPAGRGAVASGHEELRLGWLGMANTPATRTELTKVVDRNRERYRLLLMDTKETSLWKALENPQNESPDFVEEDRRRAADALHQLAPRFGRLKAVEYVQQQFERFIVDRWLPKVRDGLQYYFFDASAEYAGLGCPVPVELDPSAPDAPPDALEMRELLESVTADVNDFVHGDPESVFTKPVAFSASPDELKKIIGSRIDATVCCAAEDDWSELGSAEPVWEAVTEVHNAVGLVEALGQQPLAMSHAMRVVAGHKSRLRQAAQRVADELERYALSGPGLVQRFLDAVDAAPEQSVRLPAGGPFREGRTLSSQLRFQRRLPKVFNALRAFAEECVSSALAAFKDQTNALIDAETDLAYLAALPSGDDVRAHGEFVVRVFDSKRTKALGIRIVDAFGGVVVGGLMVRLRQWQPDPACFVEESKIRTQRLRLLDKLKAAGDALKALKRLQDSVDESLGQQREPPPREQWGVKVHELIAALSRN